MQSHELEFFFTKKEKEEKVENDSFVSTQNPTSRSTRERNGWILLAIKFKASTAEGRWMRSPVTFLLYDPGWYVHKPDDVHNKWDDNTHTYTLAFDQRFS